MFAKVRSSILRSIRRLRASKLDVTSAPAAEARGASKIAPNGRRSPEDRSTTVVDTDPGPVASMDWLTDELRKARVYGGLRHLLDRHHSLDRHIGMSEFRVYSQNGEDGIIDFLLQRLGVATGSFVEIGAERHEANCLLLALHQGWNGVFVDGDPSVAANLTGLLRHTAGVRIVNEKVEPATIDAATERWGVPAEIDVLSIDVDGSDYYVWEALRRVRARIVVIEYNAALPPDRALVQRPDAPAWDGTVNFGCSVGALRRLAAEKDYALVYLESSGTNAFLVATEHLAQLGSLPDVQLRSPNYHLRPNAGHPGTVDKARFVDVEQAS